MRWNDSQNEVLLTWAPLRSAQSIWIICGLVNTLCVEYNQTFSALPLGKTHASVFADYRDFWVELECRRTHRWRRAKSQPGGMSRNDLHSPQFCLWLMMPSLRQGKSGAALQFMLHYISEAVTLVTHDQSLCRKEALTAPPASFLALNWPRPLH